MRRAVLVLLVLLMPLRGAAAALAPLPASGTHDEAMHQMAAGADMSCCDHEEGGQSQSAPCEQHDCCATFIAPASAVPLPALAGALPIRIGARFAAGFVPEHLDPPPLAL